MSVRAMEKRINSIRLSASVNMSALIPFLAVAAGGAVGAVLRFSVYKTVDASFPWATFIVNIVGCVLASFLMFRYGMSMP